MAGGDEDVVVARPEDYRVLIDVHHSETACAGAAAGYLLRTIAYRAGCYAPGIQEVMFFELQSAPFGQSIDTVARWFGERAGDLSTLGYRVLARRVTYRTEGILAWVTEGKGYRGAVLPTEYRKLHATDTMSEVPHAVAVAVDRLDARSNDGLVQVDPWPAVNAPATNGAPGKKPSRTAVAPNLEAAHRDRKYAALILYWAGYA